MNELSAAKLQTSVDRDRGGIRPAAEPDQVQTPAELIEAELHLGIDASPGAFRTEGRRLLSLDGLPDRDTAEQDHEYHDVDWKRLARDLQFDAVQRAVFIAHYRRGIPQCWLSEELGISPWEARKTLAFVKARLNSPEARKSAAIEALRSSLITAYQDRLCSGRLVWTVNPINGANLEALARERKNLFSLCLQSDRRSTSQNLPFRGTTSGGLMTIEQLNLKRRDESAKLARLTERAHLANVACEDAERGLQVTEEGFRAEQAQAMLDEQAWPSGATEKILQAAQAKLTAARSSLTAARAAVKKQSDIVSSIDGELEARRMEAFEAALKPHQVRLEKAITELVRASLAVNEIGAAHRVDANTLGHALFLPEDPADRDFDYSLRLMKCGLVNGAIGLEAWSLLRSRHYAA